MAALKIAWNWRERLARGERGAELIEFALVLPLLLLLVLGIVDFGFMFQRLEVVTNAAREGARIAVLPTYDTPDVRLRVNNYLVGGGVPVTLTNPVVILSTVPLASPGGPITVKQVQVTYTHSYMFLSGLASLFGGQFSTVPLNAVSTMRAEGGGS